MPSRILIVLEFEPAQSAAVAVGLDLAKTGAAEVVFFGAAPPTPIPVVEFPMSHYEAPEAYLRGAQRKVREDLAAAQELAATAQVPSRWVQGEGGTLEATHIIELAQELDCDLIVVESTGRNSVVRLLDGSVIPGLITRSSIPLLVARHGAHPEARQAATASTGTAERPARP